MSTNRSTLAWQMERKRLHLPETILGIAHMSETPPLARKADNGGAFAIWSSMISRARLQVGSLGKR